MTCHYPDLGSASNWSCRKGNLLQPIKSTIQIWVVTRHQYKISALIPQTSFIRRETRGGVYVAKGRLFDLSGCIWGRKSCLRSTSQSSITRLFWARLYCRPGLKQTVSVPRYETIYGNALEKTQTKNSINCDWVRENDRNHKIVWFQWFKP